MKLSSGTRKTDKLSDSLHLQLNMRVGGECGGSGRAGFGAICGSKVVYTPADQWLPVNKYFYLDLKTMIT
jgi:hypothetical protein